ncbi:hypothetical protein ACJMK2_040093 [Sinanodonta woodiana]|uniref:Dimethylargininase n=1 Tax=Sinanodonta woodiana TaxID=1069815 RepID=A0ABD3WE42_SINWO
MTSAFRFNYAVVSRIPQSFAERGNKDPSKQIDVERAREEHKLFIETLRKCEINIIELQEDEAYPDCCFVEDCAVIIGSVAIITRPGLTSRQGETAEIRRVLKNDLKLRVMDIEDPGATLDGGDVLFTGKEIFVGVGNLSNFKGASSLTDAFPEYFVTPITLPKGVLHLKSLCSMAGNDVIAISSSDAGTQVLKQLRANAQFSYKILKMESDTAANMLYVNGRLIHRTREEIKENNWSILDEKILYPKHNVSILEIEKVRGTLSSQCLLLYKQKMYKKVTSNLADADMDAYSTLKTLK